MWSAEVEELAAKKAERARLEARKQKQAAEKEEVPYHYSEA